MYLLHWFSIDPVNCFIVVKFILVPSSGNEPFFCSSCSELFFIPFAVATVCFAFLRHIKRCSVSFKTKFLSKAVPWNTTWTCEGGDFLQEIRRVKMKIYLCGVKSENRSVAGTDKGRRADQKSSIPKSERLTSVFLPLQPEKSPFHQQIACDCRWNGDFSGASRLCGSKLARKNRPKQRDLLGFSGHPKQKRHIIKRIPPPNTAFYADVGNPTPHRPTH